MSTEKVTDRNPLSLVFEESDKTLDKVFTALVTNSHENVSFLPESIFVNYFLPFFSGKIELSRYPNILTEWISIAGSPMSEVAIIDDAKTVLYYVPGLFDTSFIQANKGAMSFGDINSQTNLLTNNLPILGERFLSKALTSVTKDIVGDSSQFQTNQQRWYGIFSRYNILPTITDTQQVKTDEKQNVVQDEIYD